MKKIFGIVGWSGSGKTDLTTRVISFFVKKKISVSSLKHTHHNFQIDKEGKDSDKHLKSGANEVMIYNENKWALISAPQKNKTKIEKIVEKFENNTSQAPNLTTDEEMELFGIENNCIRVVQDYINGGYMCDDFD